MKKILLTLGTTAATIAPLATVIACGSKATTGFVRVVGDNETLMDALQSSEATFGGSWGDARIQATDGKSDNIVAIGVEENRIPNDGIQAKKDMSAHDMYVVQALFQRLIVDTSQGLVVGKDDDGDDIKVFDIYNHGAYESITDVKREVNYMSEGVIKESKMLTTSPSENITVGGDIFEVLGSAKDYTDFTLKGDLKIDFIPSNNEEDTKAAADTLETYLNDELDTTNGNVVITVASNYTSAAKNLEEGNTDIAFLPVGVWATEASSTNFILQSGRPTQVASLGWDVEKEEVSLPTAKITNQGNMTKSMNAFSDLYMDDIKAIDDFDTETGLTGDLLAFQEIYKDPEHELNKFVKAAWILADQQGTEQFITGSYESIIYGDAKDELVQDIMDIYDTDGNNFRMDTSLLDDKTYVATSKTSSSTYIYPELWFFKHFNISFKQ